MPVSFNVHNNSRSDSFLLFHKQRDYFMNLDSFGSLLLAVAIDVFGSDFLNYKESESSTETGFLFETLIMDIEDRFRIKMPKVNTSKLGAAIAAFKSLRFYIQPTAFIAIVNGLSGHGVDCDYGSPLDPEDLLFSMWEVQKLNPPPVLNGETTQYSSSVVRYIYIILANYGIPNIPKFLKISEKTYSKVKNLIDYSALDLPDIDSDYISKAREEKAKEVMEGLSERVKEFNRQLNTLPVSTLDNFKAPS